MKQFLSIFILFFLSTTSIFAFQAGESRFYPTAGIGMSTVSCKAWSGAQLGESFSMYGYDSTSFKNAKTEPRFCWNLGVSLDYFFGEKMSLITGVLYESRPFRVVYPRNTAGSDLVLDGDFTFLTIPLGVKYYIGMFFFGGGLYYSFFLSDDIKVKYGSGSESGELEKTKNDLGFFADLGMNFNLTVNHNLLIFARYQMGLINVYEEDDILTDIKLRAITLNAAFGIKF